MKLSGPCRRNMVALLMGPVLALQCGCLSFLNPVYPPGPEVKESCRLLEKYQRDRVYVFFVNGIDPVNYGNLTGIRDYVQDLGFHKTYYGQLYHVSYFATEIRTIHKQEPDAHFVLVGFGRGARRIRWLATTVKAEGIPIDLMVCLDGQLPDGMGIESGPIPGHFQDEHFLHEPGPDQDLWQFGNPTCRQTIELLGDELAQIAATIPVVEPVELPMPRMLEEAPPPRPVTPQEPQTRDEWDFLKPEVREIKVEKLSQR